MNEKKNCSMIQDLLPSYIEDLTSKETNQIMQEHLKNCSTCKNVFENMKESFASKDASSSIQEVSYMKKFNYRFNILKILLIIIFVIFIANIGRNSFIMITLSEKNKSYQTITNYYSKYSQYNGDSITIIESYYKDGNYLRKLTDTSGETVEINNGDTSNYYSIINGEKIAMINQNPGGVLPIEITNYLDFNNILDFFKNSIISNIVSTKCNGKDCYYISNLSSPIQYKNDGYSGVYIDKKTGLPVRATGGTFFTESKSIDTMIDFYYDFNCVSNNDIQKDNVSEYKIVNQ